MRQGLLVLVDPPCTGSPSVRSRRPVQGTEAGCAETDARTHQLLELQSGGRVSRHLRYQIIDVRLSAGVRINRRPCSGVCKKAGHFFGSLRSRTARFQIPLYSTGTYYPSHFWVDGEKFLGRVRRSGGAVKGGEGGWQGRKASHTSTILGGDCLCI